jgi:hypothetical protein
MNDERRKNPRKKPEQLMYVEFGRENGGMIRDISETGFGFRSVGPLQRGEKVPFSFAFPGGELLRGEVELVWTDGDGRSGGLLFVNLPEEVRRRISAWCAREMYQPSVRSAPVQASSSASSFEELRNELRRQISPAAAATSIAVADVQVANVPAIRPPSAVAEARVTDKPAASRSVAMRPAIGSSGRATVPDSSGPSAEIENPQVPTAPLSVPSATPHPPESPAIGPQQKHRRDQSIPLPPLSGLNLSRAPAAPLVTPAPLAFDRGTNLGLEPKAPLQGSLTETSWVENVTVGWVVVAMLALTLAAAGIVFHNEIGEAFIWLGARIAGPDHSETAVQPAPASTSDASGASQTENPPADNPTSDAAAPHANAPAATTATKPVTSPGKQKSQPGALPTSSASNGKSQSAAPRTTVSGRVDDQSANAGVGADNPVPGTASQAEDDNGQTVLQQAMEILRSDNRSTDIAEAVRLLWIAVERGSSEAEVVLAELYRTGEGVAQSCDQAHILLTAAAKKGNNEAKSRLVEIEHTGCP